jgi:UDP-N-acetylmuramoylalanine--D-glutamate ligase
VPLNRHPIAAHARAAGVPVIGDIELFAQARADLPPHRVVAITGTNGKSTTTALTHHLLQQAGVPSLMGGNIGKPILEQVPLPGGVYVLELSSYQIDLTQRLDADVAVLLNVSPDHLDRYDGYDAYVASKARLFGMQALGHLALVDMQAELDDDVLRFAPEAANFTSSTRSTCPAIRRSGPACKARTTAPMPPRPWARRAIWAWTRPRSRRA